MDNVLKALRTHGDKGEQGRSSHWQEMLRHPSWTSYDGGPRHGLGEYIPRTKRRVVIHHLFQTFFRRHGKRYAAFPSILQAGRRIAKIQQRVFDLDDLRQVLTLACVRHHVRFSASRQQTLAVIGDGYGRLASLLIATLPNCRVVLVNLAPALLVDLASLRRVWPQLPVVLATSEGSLIGTVAEESPRVVAVRADEADVLRAMPIDGAFNVSSMQEMDSATIAHYFDILRHTSSSATWFYCCNATAKPLRDGTVVKFEDYPWDPQDEILLDELCPWAQVRYQVWPPRFSPRLYRIWHRLVYLYKPACGPQGIA